MRRALTTALDAQIKTPADLDAAARKNGLKVKESPFFQRGDPLPEFGPTPQVAAAAFTLKDGAVSEAIRAGKATVFIAARRQRSRRGCRSSTKSRSACASTR